MKKQKVPRLFMHNGYYCIQYPTGDRYKDGRPRYRTVSLQTADEQEADNLRREYAETHSTTSPTQLVKRETITVGEAINDFLEYVKVENQHGTYRTYESPLLRFKEFVGQDVPLKFLTMKDIDQFISACKTGKLTRTGKPASIPTTNSYIRTLKRFASKMTSWKYFKTSPFADRKQDIPDKKPPTILDDKYIVPFLNSIKDIDLRHLAAAYLLTGCRRNELLNLEWRDVDSPKKDCIFIRKSKTHLCGEVYINEQLRTILNEISKKRGKDPESKVFKPMHPDTFTHKFKEAVRDSGLPIQQLNVHALRHTVGRRMIEKGHSLADVKDRLRHQQITTTVCYTTSTPERLAQVSTDNLGKVKLRESRRTTQK